MAIDLGRLRSELQQDPAGIGYQGKSPAEQADLINSKAGPGSGPVARMEVPTTDPAMIQMMAYAWTKVRQSSDPGIKSDYNTLITLIGQVGLIRPQESQVQAVVAQAIADGVVTPSLVSAVAMKTGSRAEVLFGEDTFIQWPDIVQALAD